MLMTLALPGTLASIAHFLAASISAHLWSGVQKLGEWL